MAATESPTGRRGAPLLLLEDIDEPGLATIGVYERRGGYGSLRRALAMTPEEVLASLEASHLANAEHAPLRSANAA